MKSSKLRKIIFGTLILLVAGFAGAVLAFLYWNPIPKASFYLPEDAENVLLINVKQIGLKLTSETMLNGDEVSNYITQEQRKKAADFYDYLADHGADDLFWIVGFSKQADGKEYYGMYLEHEDSDLLTEAILSELELKLKNIDLVPSDFEGISYFNENIAIGSNDDVTLIMYSQVDTELDQWKLILSDALNKKEKNFFEQKNKEIDFFDSKFDIAYVKNQDGSKEHILINTLEDKVKVSYFKDKTVEENGENPVFDPIENAFPVGFQSIEGVDGKVLLTVLKKIGSEHFEEIIDSISSDLGQMKNFGIIKISETRIAFKAFEFDENFEKKVKIKWRKMPFPLFVAAYDKKNNEKILPSIKEKFPDLTEENGALKTYFNKSMPIYLYEDDNQLFIGTDNNRFSMLSEWLEEGNTRMNIDFSELMKELPYVYKLLIKRLSVLDNLDFQTANYKDGTYGEGIISFRSNKVHSLIQSIYLLVELQKVSKLVNENRSMFPSF